ncbi:hypothetical protein [Bathymodiolus azoricus thioautotrophic gill symbiont]|uniref:hypothetical protein n=2 Tax=sulfur-oxidizing symbionts TaxID=32036 RepID=UPI00192C7E35|nr:hypothetical protein [Bathymodiolus azoricus thioautotrophic gill symbiont]
MQEVEREIKVKFIYQSLMQFTIIFLIFSQAGISLFLLKLPNGGKMKSKICQDGGKALMSHSNKELGKWILRDILDLQEGELLTYEKLALLGIDSVRIDKISNSEFEINFSRIGSYENFKESYLDN